MLKQKIGRILFWIGIVGIIIDFFVRWVSSGVTRINTPETLIGTGWAVGELFFNLSSLAFIIAFSFSLIGALLISASKGSYFWLWVFAPIVGANVGLAWNPSVHIPSVYGIGAGVITLSYLGALWSWVTTHTAYEGIVKTGRQIQLLGYTYLYLTALFLCNYIGNPMNPGTADFPKVSSYSVLIAMSTGFVLLSIGNYLSAKETMALE